MSTEPDHPEGTVVAVMAGSAIVSVDAALACARCASGRGCGAILPGKRRKRELTVPVAAGLELRQGDIVRLALEPARLLQAAWLAYGLPLASMVAAVAAGSPVTGSDAGAIAFGAGGLLAGTLAARRILRKNDAIRCFQPRIVERPRRAGRPQPVTGC